MSFGALGDIELPCNLETIVLIDCVNLEKLPSKLHTLSSFRGLRVNSCPKLVSFPKNSIPRSVISFDITACKMLQSLLVDEPRSTNNHGDLRSCLQELTIYGCDSLPASLFSEGRFLPATLNTLEIGWCRGMESPAEINVDGLQSLQNIVIRDCKNLRSSPQGLHTLSSHLTSLKVADCPAVELERFPPLPPSISRYFL